MRTSLIYLLCCVVWRVKNQLNHLCGSVVLLVRTSLYNVFVLLYGLVLDKNQFNVKLESFG